jgi:Xaa-Pro aminopeptidase
MPAEPATGAPSRAEIARRYEKIRAAMERERVDALVVCGNQYAGFEGAVRYVSGFEIVHRYACVLLPLEGEPALIFPREAKWIGDKATSWLSRQLWPDLPGKWIREQAEARRWKRLGVYGLDAVMAVRDYRELAAGPMELVAFDRAFDLARAVKSEEELTAIRSTMKIIEEGFRALAESYAPGKTEAEIMAPAVARFFARGAGSQMMNILLSGSAGEAAAHFKVPRGRVVAAGDLLLYSLEIAGPEGYWVEFSRPLIRGKLSARTAEMAEIYPVAVEAARAELRPGRPVSRVHDAAAEIFRSRRFSLGHLSGHSIGMTMIEHPAIGAADDTTLEENMVFSFHPQVVDAEGKTCLYTQDTFRVGPQEGENLSKIPWKIFSGGGIER